MVDAVVAGFGLAHPASYAQTESRVRVPVRTMLPSFTSAADDAFAWISAASTRSGVGILPLAPEAFSM